MTVAGERPAGTVTFVFTDIEDSTDLIRGLGTERFHELLERHAGLLRAAFAAGTEIRTEGDSFFYVFMSAPGAIAAAAAAQRALAGEAWPADAVIRVRMGMHTGDATPGRPEAGADFTSDSPSTTPRASPGPDTAARCCSPRPRVRSHGRRCRPACRCATSARTG